MPEEVASIDVENRQLKINSIDLASGGFWWSVYGHFDQAENITDSSFVYKHDKMSLVQVVESCTPSVGWDEEIDLQKFGWHQGANGMEFNNYGFAPGDVFAKCSLKSSPPSYLSWESEEIDTEFADDTLSAKVPDHVVRAESINCAVRPFENFEPEFKVDQCAEVEYNTRVLAPPNLLDYSYSDTSVETVFNYVSETF